MDHSSPKSLALRAETWRGNNNNKSIKRERAPSPPQHRSRKDVIYVMLRMKVLEKKKRKFQLSATSKFEVPIFSLQSTPFLLLPNKVEVK